MKIINLFEYIEKGGFVKMFHITTEQELLNLASPNWIDSHKGKRTYCFNTNLGLMEISFHYKYEQLEIDLDPINEPIKIFFEYDQNVFKLEHLKTNLELVFQSKYDGIDRYKLPNGLELYYASNKLGCLSRRLIS